MTNEERLINITERVTRGVCCVNGIVTKQDIEELERLEKLTGKKYDAINQGWVK